jgi:hypothetical protein
VREGVNFGKKGKNFIFGRGRGNTGMGFGRGRQVKSTLLKKYDTSYNKTMVFGFDVGSTIIHTTFYVKNW